MARSLVFRHTSSGLDENTGILVHVSTTISDTTFTDNQISELTEYYYRVYVMNEFGRLGGSNIVSLTTPNRNLIVNGDFEEIGTDGLPVGWDFRNEIFKPVASSDAQSGEYYLYGNAESYHYDLSWGSVQQKVPYTNLTPGIEYELEFWYYIEALPGNAALLIEFNPDGSGQVFEPITGPASTEWQKFSTVFTTPASLADNWFLRLEVNVAIPYNGEPWKVRVDNFSLKRNE